MEKDRSDINQQNLKNNNIRKSLRIKTAEYLIAAFSLIAGLAWNDAVKTLIDYVFPLSQNTLFAKFFYAILITFIVVILSNHLITKTEK